MEIVVNNNTITDLAWTNLYKRLEYDNLLPEKELPQRIIFQPRILKWTAAAAMLIFCFVTGMYINLNKRELIILHNEKNATVLATTLDDGSVVYLSEQTTIRYPERFKKDKRVVSFEGDAFFDIIDQQERPFFIITELADIEVVGTSFHLKSDHDTSFLLEVVSGKVRVTLKSSNHTVTVKRGEKTLLEQGVLKIINNDVNLVHKNFTKIHFKDERLIDIVKIINQNAEKIRIEILPELENRVLTATFSEDIPETMIILICKALDLNYYQKGNIFYITE